MLFFSGYFDSLSIFFITGLTLQKQNCYLDKCIVSRLLC